MDTRCQAARKEDSLRVAIYISKEYSIRTEGKDDQVPSLSMSLTLYSLSEAKSTESFTSNITYLTGLL